MRSAPIDVLPQMLRVPLRALRDSPFFEPVAFTLRLGWLFYKALHEDEAFMRAAGMAYATLMALVPSLVLVFGILGSLGVLSGPEEQDLIYDALFGTFFGDVAEIRSALEPLMSNVDFGALGVVSTAVLLVVAARLFLMVERAYSDIFRVRMNRNLSQRILNFYFSITAVPIVIALSLQGVLQLGSSSHQGAVVWGLQFVLLLAALKLFPCTTVRWGPALVGAATSWVLLGVSSWAFSAYIAWSYADPAYALRAFYGSLILVPIFLLWLYTFWIVILLGVEVAQVMQNYATLLDAEMEARERDRGVRAPSVGNALEVLARIAANYRRGDGPLPTEALHRQTHLAGWFLTAILDGLVGLGLIVATEQGWVLARPAHQISLQEVAEGWIRLGRIGGDERILDDVEGRLRLEGTLDDAVERWFSTPAVMDVRR